MSPHRLNHRVEVPTLALGAVIYGSWFGLTYFFHDLPLVLALPLAAFVVAWQSSLQHEAAHGHPTSSRRFNSIFAGLSLWLYLPFPLYRDSHMSHHASPHLTSPLEDSESYYFTSAAWADFGPVRRLFWTAHNTLLGRFVFGPAVVLARVLPAELSMILRGDRKRLVAWSVHALVVAAILAWTALVCDIAVWQYLLYFVYPGMSLSLLRSFVEHKPAANQNQRIALVEAHPIFGLLFLHNNLHLLHHQQPGLPWYQFTSTYERERSALLRSNGGLVYAGYGEVFKRFFLAPASSPVHPREFEN